LRCSYTIDWSQPGGVEKHRFDSSGTTFRECTGALDQEDDPESVGGPSADARGTVYSDDDHGSCHNNWVEESSCWDVPHAPCSDPSEAAALVKEIDEVIRAYLLDPSDRTNDHAVKRIVELGRNLSLDGSTLALRNCGSTIVQEWQLPSRMADRVFFVSQATAS